MAVGPRGDGGSSKKDVHKAVCMNFADLIRTDIEDIRTDIEDIRTATKVILKAMSDIVDEGHTEY